MEETYGTTKCPARGREYSNSGFRRTGCIRAIEFGDAKPDAFDHGKRTKQLAIRPNAERARRSKRFRCDGLRCVRFDARIEHDGIKSEFDYAAELDQRGNPTGRISRLINGHDAPHSASQEAQETS
jgi:hypothetical protein